LLNNLGNSRFRNLFSEEWEGFQYLGTVAIAGVLLGLVTAKKLYGYAIGESMRRLRLRDLG